MSAIRRASKRATKRVTRSKDRGAAALELALLLPIAVVLIVVVFDIGTGFGAARSSAATARAAARVVAQDIGSPQADYQAVRAVSSGFTESGDNVDWVVVYKPTPALGAKLPPGCTPPSAGINDVCNVYNKTQIETADPTLFDDGDCAGSIDTAWCPSSRSADDDWIGVAIFGSHERLLGLTSESIGLNDSDDFAMLNLAVFPLYESDAS